MLPYEERLMVPLLSSAQHDDGDEICFSLLNLEAAVDKNSPNIGRLLREINPFVPFKYVQEKSGKPYFFPQFTPEQSTQVEILEHRPIFNSKCAVVDAIGKANKFTFFDPDFKEENYQEENYQIRTVNLAALAISETFTEKEDYQAFGFEKEYQNRISHIKPDFVRLPLGYEAIFKIIEKKEIRGKYIKLDVQNPIDRSKRIELITWLGEELQPDSNSEMITTNIYFIGSIK